MAHHVETPGLPAAVRSLIEARTGDAVFVVGPDYRISHWDHEASFLTGIRSEDVLGKRCYEVVLGERESGGPFCTYGCSVMQLARAGRPVSSYDMRVSSPSGGKRWVNVSVLSIDSDEGPYIVHLLRDSQKTHETIEMAQSLIKLSKKGEKPAGEALVRGRNDLPALTSRQLEVLNLLAGGKSAKEIGRDLYLSEATVRNHIRALLQALDAHSQLEALAKAREVGLLST
jgi:PAS domain S-box-containing protein